MFPDTAAVNVNDFFKQTIDHMDNSEMNTISQLIPSSPEKATLFGLPEKQNLAATL